MKLIKRLVIFGIIGLVVLLIVGGIVLTLTINSIAKQGIQIGATSALGVETKLNTASVGLFSGTFGLNGLDVSNPQGYPSKHFVQLGDAKVAVSLGSLTKDTIVVPEFTMDGLDVHLERKSGKSNYEVILENLDKLSGGKSTPKPTEPKPKGSEKKLIVKALTLKNITIHADMVDAGTPGLACRSSSACETGRPRFAARARPTSRSDRESGTDTRPRRSAGGERRSSTSPNTIPSQGGRGDVRISRARCATTASRATSPRSSSVSAVIAPTSM